MSATPKTTRPTSRRMSHFGANACRCRGAAPALARGRGASASSVGFRRYIVVAASSSVAATSGALVIVFTPSGPRESRRPATVSPWGSTRGGAVRGGALRLAAIEVDVADDVDLTHAACAEEAEDLEAAVDDVAGLEAHRGRVSRAGSWLRRSPSAAARGRRTGTPRRTARTEHPARARRREEGLQSALSSARSRRSRAPPRPRPPRAPYATHADLQRREARNFFDQTSNDSCSPTLYSNEDGGSP